MKDKRITIRLDCQTFEELQKILENKIDDYINSPFSGIIDARKPTMSTIVRGAIKEYCNKNKEN